MTAFYRTEDKARACAEAYQAADWTGRKYVAVHVGMWGRGRGWVVEVHDETGRYLRDA
jgi:hypothetical protein